MDSSLATRVQQRFPKHTLAVQRYRGQESLVLLREGLLDVARFLRDDPAMRFDILMDLTCVDYLKFGRSLQNAPTLATPSPLPYYMKPKPVAETWQRPVSNDQYRFEMVYHLFSSGHSHRLRVKVPVPAIEPRVDTLTGLWASANWFEREVWDMFGVTFTGHPDLRRLLMYDGFKGHPLRKDYPVSRRQPIIGPLN
jgi:NADH-quinone oxidoreductase subunit C